MREIVLVLVGAICSALGGCAASCATIWYRAKKTRQIRMEERAADQQFEVSTEALKLIRELRALLTKREHVAAQRFFKDNGSWFAINWMFLPSGFVEGWKSIGLALADLLRADDGSKTALDEQKEDEYSKKAVGLGADLPKQALKAENALRKKMGLTNAQ